MIGAPNSLRIRNLCWSVTSYEQCPHPSLIVMSTLKSIVGDYHVPRWEDRRLDSNDLLVQLHNKFLDMANNGRESAQDESMDNNDKHGQEEGDNEGEHEGR